MTLKEKLEYVIKNVKNNNGYMVLSSVEKSDKAIVLIHGISDHKLTHYEAMYDLCEKGYDVISYDLLGHGENGGPVVISDIDFTAYWRQLDDIISRLDYKNVSLVGHSLGGYVTAGYADCYGFKGSVVLINPMLDVKMPWMVKKMIKMMPSINFGLKMLNKVDKKVASDVERLKIKIEYLRKNEELERSWFPKLSWLKSGLLACDRLKSKMEKGKYENWKILYGEKDQIVDLDVIKRVNVKKKGYKEGCHDLFFEKDEIYKDVIKEIDEFCG